MKVTIYRVIEAILFFFILSIILNNNLDSRTQVLRIALITLILWAGIKIVISRMIDKRKQKD